MRVLVTGASGLLGRAVVAEFKNAGHEGIPMKRHTCPTDHLFFFLSSTS